MEIRGINRSRVQMTPQKSTRAAFGKRWPVWAFPVLFIALYGCFKKAEIDPGSSNQAFDVKLVSATPGFVGNRVEVNPLDDISLNFHFTCDAQIFEIDMKTKDWRNGELQFSTYPEHSDVNGNFSLYPNVVKTSVYDFVVPVKIHIPSYSKDSIILTVKALRKTDFAVKECRVVLLVKNPQTLMFSNTYVGQQLSDVPGFTMQTQTKITLQGGLIGAKKIDRVKCSAVLNGVVLASKPATLYTGYGADTYTSLNCSSNSNGGQCISYAFYTPESTEFFKTSHAMVGQDFKIRMVAFSDDGDSITKELPVSVVFPAVNELPPANLGAPKNKNLGRFFYHTKEVISNDISDNNGSSATFGFFQLGGENKLGSATFIYPKASELGYVLGNSYVRSATYFRKVDALYEQVDARYLDTVQVNGLFPEQITIQPNDVIVFGGAYTTAKGVVRINTILPSDSGSINFTCKYQKP